MRKGRGVRVPTLYLPQSRMERPRRAGVDDRVDLRRWRGPNGAADSGGRMTSLTGVTVRALLERHRERRRQRARWRYVRMYLKRLLRNERGETFHLTR